MGSWFHESGRTKYGAGVLKIQSQHLVNTTAYNTVSTIILPNVYQNIRFHFLSGRNGFYNSKENCGLFYEAVRKCIWIIQHSEEKHC